MPTSRIHSIGLFIDGQYYYRLDKALQQTQSRRVKLEGLIDFIERTLSAKYGLDREAYASFICEQFAAQNKSITPEAVDFILEWTRCHTFYTQSLCNRVFSAVKTEAALVDVLIAADAILKENSAAFLERRPLLTSKQWKFLTAVAKEGEVSEPTGASFLQKYGLGAPSSAVRILKALTEKELLLETKSLDGSSYCVYNVFFSRWLERL